MEQPTKSLFEIRREWQAQSNANIKIYSTS